MHNRHLRVILATSRDGFDKAAIMRGLRRLQAFSIPLQSSSFPVRKCGICCLPSYRKVREPRDAIVWVDNAHTIRPMPVCATHARRNARVMASTLGR